jgi:hypothetical protein
MENDTNLMPERLPDFLSINTFLGRDFRIHDCHTQIFRVFPAGWKIW